MRKKMYLCTRIWKSKEMMLHNESKYKLIVRYVQEGISAGRLRQGDWIPSINEFRQMFNLSRDTVFAGVTELKARGIVESRQGKGYYVSKTNFMSDYNIFLLFNELNEFKEELYSSFMEHLDSSNSVNLQFHNYNRNVFDQLLAEARGKYNTYIVMTGKFLGTEDMLNSLGGRVYLLDHYDKELAGKYSAVAQDFENDTYDALLSGAEQLGRYKRFIMVQNEAKEPYERFYGLKRYCQESGQECKYLNSIDNRRIREGDVFILVNDKDLVTVIKQAARQGMTPGRDFGIISYNETPLKEVLCGGITTLSTDFDQMGQTMAQLLEMPGINVIRNPWRLHVRGSI